MMIRAILLSMSALALAACSGNAEPASGGDVVTIFGEIETGNRAAMDPVTEPLFQAYGISFDDAHALSVAQLEQLDQHTVNVDYPDGGDTRTFSGPLLRDVLDAAGASGSQLTITALDGYQRDIESARTRDHDVILAIHMENQPLAIGSFGPAMIVWPRNDDEALADMDDSDWVWGVFAIEIR